jgi:hypothetical protein
VDNFSVDGLALVDPANPAIQPATEPEVSILELPGAPALLTEFQVWRGYLAEIAPPALQGRRVGGAASSSVCPPLTSFTFPTPRQNV